MANENRGSLSLNAKKTTDKHPDYKGKITIDGKQYWLSGWSKTNDSGDWISLSADLANGNTATAAKPIAKPAAAPFADDDMTIPF